ncbi:MAG: hypothetical protein E6Q62_08515 [Nitrosomonas sp.]|nr:MAG: hypothetical protein E6Q62_08515 [Nitrosomonas sp.]
MCTCKASPTLNDNFAPGWRIMCGRINKPGPTMTLIEELHGQVRTGGRKYGDHAQPGSLPARS